MGLLSRIFEGIRVKVGGNLIQRVLCSGKSTHGEADMHFVVACEIKAVLARKTEIQTEVYACLKPYSFVRPISNVYVVKVDSQVQADLILQSLVSIGKKYGSHLNFIVTPVMSGGSYNGWLPPNFWPEIAERTK